MRTARFFSFYPKLLLTALLGLTGAAQAASAPVSVSAAYGLVSANLSQSQGQGQSQAQPRAVQAQRATVAVIRQENFLQNRLSKIKDQVPFCSHGKFEDERMWANCSGTLIAEDLILTAGHCIRSWDDCANISVLFDFNKDEDIEQIKGHSDQAHSCDQVVAWSQPVPRTQLVDYAILHLSKPVKDRAPLKLRASTKLQPQNITALGHPQGIAKKGSRGYVSTMDFAATQDQQPFFYSHMVGPAGLSGAGVYDENFNLAGIFVRSETGYIKADFCMQDFVCDETDCPRSEIQKITPDILQAVSTFEESRK